MRSISRVVGVSAAILALVVGAAPPVGAQTGPLGGLFPTTESFVQQVYSDVFDRPADPPGLRYWSDRINSVDVSVAEVYNEFLSSAEFAGNVAPVARLYLSVFDRQPDLEGMRFWVGKRSEGAPLVALADAFLASNEFEALSTATTDQEIVEAVYGRVLGRTPDAEGLAFWTGEIAAGRLTVPQFVVAVSESPEHQARRNPDVLVTVAYLGLLQRLPEPGGLSFWSEHVRNGESLLDLTDSIVRSDEYRNRFQSSAPAPSIAISVVAEGLTIPWDVAPLPDGRLLVTERAGGFSLIDTGGSTTPVTADLSDLFASGETGLMGLTLDPSFATNGRFYSCQGHSSPREIQVVSWSLDGSTATRVSDPLVGGLPISSGRHGGCQLSFDQDGYLVVGTGDSANGSLPQNLTSLGGKTLRVDPETGSGAPDNPFASSANANTRRLLSFGHRNIQGVDVHPRTGEVWTVEHGPDRDDEINRIVAGKNYGWNPVPGYNESVPMTDLAEFPTAEPAAWSTGSPTLALADNAFLTSSQWGSWRYGMAVTSLKNRSLRIALFDVDDGAYLGHLPVIDGDYGRLRSVAEGPDGSLFVTTSNGGGRDVVLRVQPSLN